MAFGPKRTISNRAWAGFVAEYTQHSPSVPPVVFGGLLPLLDGTGEEGGSSTAGSSCWSSSSSSSRRSSV